MSSATGATGQKALVSVVIPTRNEERNLALTLSSVTDWASEVFVFDSFSDDRTLEIASGFKVEIVQRVFDDFATHKNWALDNLPFQNQWILFLDADERLTSELRDEISRVVSRDGDPNGYYVARKNYFMRQWIRHAGMYPDWQLRLFRHGTCRYEDRLVHEHMLVDGTTAFLKNPLEHHDFKGLERWFDRHNRYTSMEASEIRRVLHRDRAGRISGSLWSRGPERTRIVKEFAYRYLPCRAVFVFIWMYLIRGGFLDGRIGFRYCVLKAFVDYQTSVKLLELQAESYGPVREIAQSIPPHSTSVVSSTRSPQHDS
jgi:glycosyltransferase involved in cell wall biosynthesis